MLSIQIVSLIIFVVGIVIIPVVDQLFFYSAFNFKDGLKGTVENVQTESRDNLKSDKKTTDGKIDSNAAREIPVGVESFEVEKREVKTGSVHLHSRIIEHPDEDPMRLREGRVSVERNTVDRPATSADFADFQEKNIGMVERAEIPIIGKEDQVLGEFNINKNIEERKK